MRRPAVLIALVLTCALSGMAPASAEDPPPSVTMTKDRAYYVSGQTEKITVVASGIEGGNPEALRITLLLPNGTSKVLEESSIVNEVPSRFSYAPYVNHVLRADLVDTTTDELLDSAQLTVVQLANLSTDPKGGFLGYSGAYAVFPKRSRPVFRSRDLTGKVAPRCLRHQVQRRYASGWKPVFTSACRAEQRSVVDWKWLGKHPSGVRFRVRATFAGDKWNRGNRAAWQYFRLR
ncbi:hypothetical protein EFK50_12555 [Nocardioides marmoriginsengisoli]|uniref:Uncharacterized protein n=1 Tax=Nocardioides marmoriginsengisoli TaxID=661483 RepID=A0A3N0CGM1_9ACTN|nr:hypothetical protein [Nocardioides marmoriginsengisoli]RNL62587.1 hypothetical protein EFK50_12555 [Nocardioides marmoriginsengisoli]